MDHSPAQVRPYRAEDLDALYEVCLLTADNGGDGTAQYADPRLPGLVHAAPYGLFAPDLAFVVEDAAGVGGYIVGARDSRAFEARLELEWWPPLRARYPGPPPELPAERRTGDQRQAFRIHHPWLVSDAVYARFPSHLHINLDARARRQGWGTKLLAALFDQLRAGGSAGVHLTTSTTNTRAIAFYHTLGFEVLEQPGTATVMGLRFDGSGRMEASPSRS